MRVKELGSPPSISECLAIGQIGSEAFTFAPNDEISRYLPPPQYRFVEQIQAIKKCKSPREKLDKIANLGKLWKYEVWLYAWRWYAQLSRPGIRAFVGYNDDDVPIGIAVWSIPVPLRPLPSFYMRAWYCIRKVRAWLNHTWLQFWYPGLSARSLHTSKALFQSMEDEFDITHTESKVDKLLKMNEKERSNTPYTTELSYFLQLFSISEQNKGHGSNMLRNMDLQVQPCKYRGVVFEPQRALVASPMGMPLYKKFGFRTIATAYRNIEGAAEPIRRDLMIA